ncbi:MAG: sensor histidine kinase [Crocinitomicaceae bacterium]|nr:sensor histidine kinase [Crocinitomicaceae bacterium]
MEKYANPVKDRFKLAMIPSLLLGVLTNVHIGIIILNTDFPLLLLSPFIGTIFFLLAYNRLKQSKISAKSAFIAGAIIVTFEVIIHTYFFGWGAGFYFFLFLLPLVFLLESNWTVWGIVLFNFLVFGVIISLKFGMNYTTHPSVLDEYSTRIVSYLNGALTGLVAVAIVIYSSKALSKRDQLLMEIISDLEISNRKIAKQHDNQKILLKEIHHRVKNNLQIISSLLSLQSSNLEDDRISGVLNESRSRVEAIALIHKKLYQDESGGNAVDFKAYLEDFIVKQRMLNPRIKFDLRAEELILHLDIAVPLGLIVSELITNAVKHAFEGLDVPKVTIQLVGLGDHFELWVRDNGIGLSDDFDFNSNELGLGADIIVALTDQIDAQMSFYNKKGASFKISFENKALD